jgi:TP901 family phage tail tape measure protein
MPTSDQKVRFVIETSGEADLEQLAKSLDAVGDQGGEAGEKAKALVAQLDQLIAAARAAAAFKDMTAAIAKTDAELAQARDGLAKLNQEFSDTDRSSRAVAKAFTEAERAVSRLEAEQRKQTGTLDALDRELREAGVDTSKLGDETERLAVETAKTTGDLNAQVKALERQQEAAAASAKRWRQFGDDLDLIRGGVTNLSENLAKIGVAAAAAGVALAGIGAAKLFTAGIDQAGQFERSLKQIQAAAGATAEQMVGFKAAIEAAADSAGRSVGDAAIAFEGLVRDGATAEQAALALASALNFATASVKSAEDATALLGGALDAFGLDATNTGRVADLLAAAALRGGTAIADLGDALVKVGPTARSLGLDMETTAAALALLAQNGLDGGRAATALTMILSDLADPTSRLSQELAALGITSRDLGVVIDALGQRGAGAEAAFNALGARGSAALRLLASAGTGSLQSLRAEFDNVAGASQTAADVINDSYEKAVERIGIAFDNLRRLLVEPLLGPLQTEIDNAAARLQAFAASPEFEQIQQALVAMFKAGVDAAAEFAAAVDWSTVAQDISTFASEARASFEAFSAGTKGARDEIIEFINRVEEVSQRFEQLNEIRKGAIESVTAIGAAFPIAANRVAELTASLLGFDGAAAEFGANVDTIVGFVSGMREEIDTTAAAAKRLGPAVAEGLGTAAAEVEAAAGGIAETAEAAGASIEKLSLTTETSADRIVRANTDASSTLERLARAAARVWTELQQAIADGAPAEKVDALRIEFAQLNKAITEVEPKLKASAEATLRDAEAAEKGAAANRQLADAKGDLAVAADAAADAVDRAARAQDEANRTIIAGAELTQRAAAQLEYYAGDIVKLSRDQARQTEEARRHIEALDAQIAQYDTLGQSVVALQGQYSLLDDSTLQQIAQREQRLQQERQRIEQERAELAREQAAAATSPAAPPPRPPSSPGGSTGGGVARGGVTINVNITGGFVGTDPNAVARELARLILPEIRRLEALGA